MNNSANSNMYFLTIEKAWERFGAHLEGNQAGLLCVISNTDLVSEAKTALEASSEKLGYGPRACTFITRYKRGEATGEPLSTPQLTELIEMLDPAVLIITDAESARALEEAYRVKLVLPSFDYIDGRATVAFNSFPSMLTTPEEKQRAWALLKRLAK